jgi:hypothetical protein
VQTDGKVGETNKRFLEDRLQTRNSATTALIQECLDLLSVRSMTVARNATVFFKSVMTDPDARKHNSHGHLDHSPGKSISRVVQECFGSGVGLRYRKIHRRLPFLTSTFLHQTARIGLALISQRTTREASKLFCVKRLLAARYADDAAGIRLDIGSDSVAIPID